MFLQIAGRVGSNERSRFAEEERVTMTARENLRNACYGARREIRRSDLFVAHGKRQLGKLEIITPGSRDEYLLARREKTQSHPNALSRLSHLSHLSHLSPA
jgi:hypothetical protein